MIPTVRVTRYVTPLREGGSLPGIVEADDPWLEPVPGAEDAQALRTAYVDFLIARLGTRQWLPSRQRAGGAA